MNRLVFSLALLLLVGTNDAFVPAALPSASTRTVPSTAGTFYATRATPKLSAAAAAASKESTPQTWTMEDADTIFAVIDEDGNGSISKEELTEHMAAAGYAKEASNKIFKVLDKNGDGMISKGEFRAGLVSFSQLQAAPGLGTYNSEFVKEITEDAEFLFSAVDTDGNGSVSFQELKEHLNLQSKFSDKAISNIFSMLDVNKDREISKEELTQAFIRCSAIRQALGEGPNFK